MNEMHLSKRLEYVGDFVPENSRLADIGSDHAYLPVALMLQKKIAFAVAGEVVKGPFESAKKQVMKSGLVDYIIVRLADGLDAIVEEDQITAVTICGMGGALIRNILEAGWQKQKINGSERLILQPNVGEHLVRQWLVDHEYSILAEKIMEENNKRYEIIVAEKLSQVEEYSEAEILFGPKLLQQKSTIFEEKWQSELKQRQAILEKLQQAKEAHTDKKQQINAEIEWIKEVLN